MEIFDFINDLSSEIYLTVQVDKKLINGENLSLKYPFAQPEIAIIKELC